MEKDLEKIKNTITHFIEKYQIKTFKINTNIEYHSRLKRDWDKEYYSTVNKIDINLTK